MDRGEGGRRLLGVPGGRQVARLGDQIRSPLPAPAGFAPGLLELGPLQISPRQVGPGEERRGRGIVRVAVHDGGPEPAHDLGRKGQLAIHGAVLRPGEPAPEGRLDLGGNRPARCALEGRLDQRGEGEVGGGVRRHGEELLASAEKLAVRHQPSPHGEPGGELRREGGAAAIPRRAETPPLAADSEGLGDPAPRRRALRHRSQRVRIVAGDRQPGLDQPVESAGVREGEAEELAGELAFGWREGRPELEVGRRQVERRLALSRCEAASQEEGLLPGSILLEQARIAGERPVEVGGGAQGGRRVPRGGAAGESLAGELAGGGQPGAAKLGSVPG